MCLSWYDYFLNFHLMQKFIMFYYSTIAPLYHIREKERAKYATSLHCRTGQNYRLKVEQQKSRTKPYFISKWNNKSLIRRFNLQYELTFNSLHVFFLTPSGLGKIQSNLQNIRAYYMLNHQIRCMYFITEKWTKLTRSPIQIVVSIFRLLDTLPLLCFTD